MLQIESLQLRAANFRFALQLCVAIASLKLLQLFEVKERVMKACVNI